MELINQYEIILVNLDPRMAKANEKIPTIYSILFELVGMGDTVRLNRSRTIARWKRKRPQDMPLYE